MITTFVQPNTSRTPSGEGRTSTGSAMPFGFTFALQAVRTDLVGARLLNAIEEKEAALYEHNEYIEARRSGIKLANDRI